MNTPAHLIFAAAAFARPGARGRNLAALAGGFAPDLSLFLLIGWAKLVAGRSPHEIFREDYVSPLWQGIFRVDNSIPLWGALLAAGMVLRRELLAVFAGAALLHLAFDLPLHHSDARPHFWPLSEWVFRSPLSYWNPARHGHLVGAAEVAACVALCALLWRRFRSRPARALIAAGLLAELAPGLIWPLLLG
ncbi:MAG: cobalamin biosynthesis protein CobQ [Pseudomonadota bacterium]|nr:cobalamin biosynthesis protein CobQ [Pseudomonadota bacterium]MEE3098688.1 cobalamin biosynthesis protein CobQ [Pseudomonadota bacterium]